jgi:hypothetical protein
VNIAAFGFALRRYQSLWSPLLHSGSSPFGGGRHRAGRVPLPERDLELRDLGA